MRGKATDDPAGKACRSIAMADPRDAAAVDDDAAAVEVPPARPEFVLCRFLYRYVWTLVCKGPGGYASVGRAPACVRSGFGCFVIGVPSAARGRLLREGSAGP